MRIQETWLLGANKETQSRLADTSRASMESGKIKKNCRPNFWTRILVIFSSPNGSMVTVPSFLDRSEKSSRHWQSPYKDSHGQLTLNKSETLKLCLSRLFAAVTLRNWSCWSLIGPQLHPWTNWSDGHACERAGIILFDFLYGRVWIWGTPQNRLVDHHFLH